MTHGDSRGSLPRQTLLPAVPEPTFDRFAELTRRVLGVPTALVSLVDEQRQAFPGAVGLPEPWQTQRETPLTHSFCQYVVADAAPLIVTDARTDQRLAANLAVGELGVVAYAGMPLMNQAGAVIGSLCAIDGVAREWTETELANLRDLASACSSELQLRELAERSLVESSRIQKLIDSMPVGFVAYDAEWRITAANAEAARILDHTVADLVGHDRAELFPESVGSEVDAFYRRVRETGETELFEYFYPAPLNKWYEVRVQSAPPGISVFFVDVTERRAAAARAETILQAMPVGFVALDEDFRISAANELGAALVASTPQSLVGNIAWELFPELEESEFGQTFKRVAATSASEVVESYYPAPLDAWYDVRAVGDNGRLSLFFTDVSERHEVQQVLERAAAHDRSVAHTLQQALLTDLPTVPGLALAARYLPAESTEQVGGDWYDAVVQPDGSLAVSLGDVSGHGIEAAATMGQLRAMLRGFLWDEDGTVADALSRLDKAARGNDGIALATLISGRIVDGGTHPRFVWSNAGHPPPLLLLADGTVERVTAVPELMLGVDPGVARSDHVQDLPPGSTVVLYTDGLIETRTQPFELGIDRLAEALTRHHASDLDTLLDRTLDDLRVEHQNDDIAMLAIRIDVG